jgi:hypothetical protein
MSQWSRESGRCGLMTSCALATCLPDRDNTFAVLRLLPMSDRDIDAEILALRHQIAVWNATWAKPPGARAFLPALVGGGASAAGTPGRDRAPGTAI